MDDILVGKVAISASLKKIHLFFPLKKSGKGIILKNKYTHNNKNNASSVLYTSGSLMSTSFFAAAEFEDLIYLVVSCVHFLAERRRGRVKLMPNFRLFQKND